MGNFRSDSRGGFGGRTGGRSGGRDRGFDRRDSGRFERRPAEMHDVTCDKCGKECQVPFRPTGDKPVLCSDCFRKKDSSGSGSLRMSLEQFDTINKKLDKIIAFLGTIEIDDEDEEEEEDEDDVEDEEDAENDSSK